MLYDKNLFVTAESGLFHLRQGRDGNTETGFLFLDAMVCVSRQLAGVKTKSAQNCIKSQLETVSPWEYSSTISRFWLARQVAGGYRANEILSLVRAVAKWLIAGQAAAAKRD